MTHRIHRRTALLRGRPSAIPPDRLASGRRRNLSGDAAGEPAAPAAVMQTRPLGTREFQGMLLMLVTVLLFSTMDTAAKFLVRHYPVGMVLWARFLVHTLLLLAVVVPLRGLSAIGTRRLPLQFLRGLLLSAASFLFVTAIKLMPLAEATAIAFIAPILVTLLAVVVLGEKVEAGRWVAIVCAFAGVLVIIRPGTAVFTWAAILPLVNAAFFATYQVLTRRYAGQESPYAMLFYPGLVGLAAYSLTWSDAWQLPTVPWHFALLLASGVLSASSHLIMIKAYELADASRIAPFSYSQLIWVTLSGYVFFGHFPDGWSLAGIAVLVASGVYCVNHQRISDRGARRAVATPPPGD